MLEIAALVVLSAVGATIFTLTADLRAKRVLGRVPRTSIAAATDGEWLKIVGTVRRTEAREPCIEDDTGRAYIEADRMLGLVDKRYTRVGAAYLEERLDQRVAIFGWASWESDAVGSYRGSGKRLVLRGTKRALVVVTTDARLVT
jgi:hypothetical protein